MKLEVIPSSLDTDFGPLAQYFWNVSNGLSPRFSDCDSRENQSLNNALIARISSVVAAIKAGEAPSEFNMEMCANYTQESSTALCTLLDTLVEHEESVQEAWDNEGIDSYEILGEIVDLLAQPQCPRPVVWHLIKAVSTSGMRWVCDDQKTPYFLYAIGRNPVVGDPCFIEHLSKYNETSGDGLISTSTAYDAFKNPSLTVSSLERLYCDYWYDFDPDWA